MALVDYCQSAYRNMPSTSSTDTWTVIDNSASTYVYWTNEWMYPGARANHPFYVAVEAMVENKEEMDA